MTIVGNYSLGQVTIVGSYSNCNQMIILLLCADFTDRFIRLVKTLPCPLKSNTHHLPHFQDRGDGFCATYGHVRHVVSIYLEIDQLFIDRKNVPCHNGILNI